MIKDINNIDPMLLEQDDRIEAYLKGHMSADEEQLFLKELEEKPELKEKAVVTARLIKGLKKVGAEQDKDIMGAFLASSELGVETVAKNTTQIEEAAYVSDKITMELEEDSSSAQTATQESKTIPIRKASTWLSIAASLVFIVWLGFEYIDYRGTTGLGEEYGNAFTSNMIARGADSHTDAEKRLESLFANVKNGNDLEDAIHELSLLWELSTMETYNDYTDYTIEIGWNLAIAYLKNNDKDRAKGVLETLTSESEEGSAIQKLAKELLDQL
jgi:hypothetical protein